MQKQRLPSSPRTGVVACLAPEADCPAVATLFCQKFGEILPAPCAVVPSVYKHERIQGGDVMPLQS